MKTHYGFLRLKQIIAPDGPIPVSKSTWWAGVASGRYPKPVRLGPRITAWRSEDITCLIEALSKAQRDARAED
jgi:predicted DNA-binding transcriptional regulator AlpA